jgi:hypothetical protein
MIPWSSIEYTVRRPTFNWRAISGTEIRLLLIDTALGVEPLAGLYLPLGSKPRPPRFTVCLKALRGRALPRLPTERFHPPFEMAQLNLQNLAGRGR